MTFHMCLRDEPCKYNIHLNSKTCIVIVNNDTLFACGIYINKLNGVSQLTLPE